MDTAFGRGWAALTNGDLIAAAESAGFEVLITADQNLAYQQNLAQRRLAIVVIDTNRWPRLASSTDLVLSAIDTSTAGSFQVVRCF